MYLRSQAKVKHPVELQASLALPQYVYYESPEKFNNASFHYPYTLDRRSTRAGSLLAHPATVFILLGLTTHRHPAALACSDPPSPREA